MPANIYRVALVCLIVIPALNACSHSEPLETAITSPVVSKAVPQTDQAVIADAVGQGTVGSSPLAWANPSTGSAGVIDQIDASSDGAQGCRSFVTSQQTLDGMTRFVGVACRSGNSWKMSSVPQ